MSVATRPKTKTDKKTRFGRPVQIGMPDFEIGPDDTVVDVGCGDGVCCVYAGNRGAAVIGIDIEPTLVEQANLAMRDIPARSWQGIVSNSDPIPVADATASVVICTEVMEHVDDPARLAAELSRIAKPGARYLISVPDPASEGLMRHVAPPWYWRPPFHRRVIQHHELDAVLKTAGIDVERRDLGGSYYTVRWLLWMTLVADPYDTAENTPLMKIWDQIWGVLMASPHAPQIVYALERTLPKSQIVLASKSGGSRFSRLRRALVGPTGWRSRLRSGSFRLGDFEFGWYARRHRRAS